MSFSTLAPQGTRTTETQAGKAHRRRWLTLAVLSLSLLVVITDTTIVTVAIPTLAGRLHAGPSSLEWIVDSYTLAFATLLLPAGALGDRYGRQRALAVGMAIFGTASLGAALSTSATELIVFRTMMGGGAALISPATMALLTTVFTDPAERTKAIGIWSSAAGLGVALGPTAGGWLLDHFAWGSIFMVNVPIVAVALISGRFLLPASKAPHPQRFDPPGILLAVLACAGLTYTVIEAGSAGWTCTATLVRAAVSVILLAAFIGWELRTDHPMVQLAIFRNPRFSAASGAIMVLFFGLSGMTFTLTQVYQFVLGYSPLDAGLRSLPSALAMTVGPQLGTRLAARFGPSNVITAGLLLAAAGLGYFLTSTGGSSYPHYLITAVPTALGIGLTMANANATIMSTLPPAQVGIGAAINNTTRTFGTVLGVAVIGSVAATSYAHRLAHQPMVPAAARQSIGSAAALGRHIPPADADAFHATVASAFVHGVALGLAIPAGLALITAIVIYRYLPRH
jgi:EmrB/QacA subfamily drug resistance transporter